MAHSTLSFLFIFNIMIAMSAHAVAGRYLPDVNSSDKLHPEFFLGHHHEGTVLIPGFGRVVVPDKFHHKHINPFTYNPITGTNGGNGLGIGTIGGGGVSGAGGRTGRSYIPGGDDTFVPNPGFEVPIPGSGGINVPPAGSHN